MIEFLTEFLFYSFFFNLFGGIGVLVGFLAHHFFGGNRND
jgi:hypothetical protein